MKNRKQSASTFERYFAPLSCLICQDVLIEINGSTSFLRIYDRLQTMHLPTLAAMWVVFDFAYNEDVPFEEHTVLRPKFKLELVNPLSQKFDVAQMEPSAKLSKDDLCLRLMFNLTGAIQFSNAGNYHFNLLCVSPWQPQLVYSRSLAVGEIPQPSIALTTMPATIAVNSVLDLRAKTD